LTAQQLSFISNSQTLKFEKQVQLDLRQQSGSHLRLKANLIEYRYQNLQQLEPVSIRAEGEPLQLELLSSGTESVQATAQKLNYHYSTQQLVLEGEVELIQAGDVIRAAKILYNTQTREWQAPQIENQRVKVILNP
jgi:lipopolysaccharide transport protein LptA